MEPIDSIDLTPLTEGQSYFSEIQENISVNSAATYGKKGCGDTRRRALAEQFGGLQALPPKWQAKREKDAILTDETIKNLLNHQEILEIRKVEGGYLVLTADKQLTVEVNYLPRPMPGPAYFELNAQEVQPR